MKLGHHSTNSYISFGYIEKDNAKKSIQVFPNEDGSFDEKIDAEQYQVCVHEGARIKAIENGSQVYITNALVGSVNNTDSVTVISAERKSPEDITHLFSEEEVFDDEENLFTVAPERARVGEIKNCQNVKISNSDVHSIDDSVAVCLLNKSTAKKIEHNQVVSLNNTQVEQLDYNAFVVLDNSEAHSAKKNKSMNVTNKSFLKNGILNNTVTVDNANAHKLIKNKNVILRGNSHALKILQSEEVTLKDQSKVGQVAKVDSLTLQNKSLVDFVFETKNVSVADEARVNCVFKANMLKLLDGHPKVGMVYDSHIENRQGTILDIID